MMSHQKRLPQSQTLCNFADKVGTIVDNTIPKSFSKFAVVDWLNYYNGDLNWCNVDNMNNMAYNNPHTLLFVVFRDNPKRAGYRKFWKSVRQMSLHVKTVLCPVSAVPYQESEKSRDDQAVMLLYRVLCGEFGEQCVDCWSNDQYRDAKIILKQRCPPYQLAIMWKGYTCIKSTINPNRINGIHPCYCRLCEYY